MCIIVSHKPFKGEYQMCFSALSYSVYVYQISLYFICDSLINHYLLTLPAYFLTYLLTYLLTRFFTLHVTKLWIAVRFPLPLHPPPPPSHFPHPHTHPEREREYPASILYKSIAGRYQPVSYPDGPMTARYRFIKNAYRVYTLTISVKIQLNTSIRAIWSMSSVRFLDSPESKVSPDIQGRLINCAHAQVGRNQVLSKIAAEFINIIIIIIGNKILVSREPSARQTILWNVKPYFLWKMTKKKVKLHLL